MSIDLPLARLRILDLTEGDAQYCGRYLADLGAQVILVESFTPEESERLRLTEDYPGLVVVSVTAFGRSGPYRDFAATEPVLAALGGVLSRSGRPGARPVLPPPGLIGQTAAVHAAWAALVAYAQRRRTGTGEHADVPALEAVVHGFDPGFGAQGSAAAARPEIFPRGRPDAADYYPVFRCADGRVRICVLYRRQWRAMFAWLGEPAEFADPRYDTIAARFAAAGQLNPLIAALFAGRAREELVAEGARRGIPVAGVLTPAEVLTARHFGEAGTLADAELAEGVRARVPSGYVRIDGVRAGLRRRAPRPGEHDEAAFGPRPEPPALDLGGSPEDGPLAGLRVLDLGVIVFGAEPGRRLFLDLVRQADVVLANFKPGTLASLGLSYAELSQVNPRIIVSDSSAFGSTGAWSGRLGYGPLVRASCGVSELWRDPDGAFCDGVTVYPDHVAAHVAAIAVLAAVIGRARSGRGAALEVAQADVAVMHLGPVLAALGAGQSGSPGDTARVLPCAGDDEWCVIDVRDEGDRARLADLVGGADLARWTAERRPDAVMAAAQAAGVPAGSMRRLPELPADPHLAARQSFRTMSHPLLSRPVPANARAARFSTIGDPPLRPAPVPGQHTRQVAEALLGLAPADIDHLVDKGVLQEGTA